VVEALSSFWNAARQIIQGKWRLMKDNTFPKSKKNAIAKRSIWDPGEKKPEGGGGETIVKIDFWVFSSPVRCEKGGQPWQKNVRNQGSKKSQCLNWGRSFQVKFRGGGGEASRRLGRGPTRKESSSGMDL